MGLLSFLKKTPANRNTVHDPDFMGQTEPAFKYLSTQYYRFKKDADMPWGRYKWVSTFLHEVEMRMDLQTLGAYLDHIEKNISGGKGKIDLNEVSITIQKMRSRIELAFDVKTAMKLASVIYFDENENLTEYDREKGREKIVSWGKDAKNLDFFLTRPMSELLKLSDISPSALQDYISQQVEIIEALTSGMPGASSESTSTNKSNN